MIGEPHEDSVKPCGVNLADHTHDFTLIDAGEVAEPHKGGAVKSTRHEIRIGRLHELVLIRLPLMQLGADPADEDVLIGSRQMAQHQRRPELWYSARELRQANQHHIAGTHASGSGFRSASLYSGSSVP